MLTAADGQPVLTPDEMRAAETRAIAAGTPAGLLMERAGAAAAVVIQRFAARCDTLVLCGPGNNGGDGWVVVRRLAAAGWPVRVAAVPPASDLCRAMAARWAGPVETLETARPAALIVDALLGTGTARPLEAGWQAALDRLARQGRAVALDCPSGIDMGTGIAHGTPLAAALTIAFGALKTGNVLGDGRRLGGRTVVADIGIDPGRATARLTAAPRFVALPPGVHKYARGHALIVAGATGRDGAARLAARAALRSGAGVVTLAGPPAVAPVDAIMRCDDADGHALLADRRTTAVAIGPGLDHGDRTVDWLRRLLAGTVPVVLDAGALTSCEGRIGALAASTAPLVLTPHDGEFARLFGPPGADRLAAATRAAAAARAVVVLKGPETVVAAPDGRVAINIHAAPWLATAGSGDVLAGIVAGLLAQGHDGFDAARVAVWLHGDAGRRGGPGLIADDLPEGLPEVMAAL